MLVERTLDGVHHVASVICVVCGAREGRQGPRLGLLTDAHRRKGSERCSNACALHTATTKGVMNMILNFRKRYALNAVSW